MHELSVTQALLDSVNRAAAEQQLSRVSRVNLIMGEGFDYVPEVIQEYFTALAEGTPAEGAVISTTSRPVKIYCHRCDKTYDEKGLSTIRCVHCGTRDIDIVSGKELFIDSIETDM